jgi:hypothetical protein
MGDSLEEPRHTLFFLYCLKGSTQAPDFARRAESALSKGLTVAGRDDNGMIVEGHLRVDPISIAPLLAWADKIAEEAHALFDGWECAVIAPKH